MSDESTVMPDSSSLSREEADSQTATQATGDNGAESAEATGSSQETQPKTGDYSVLEKRLADTETALKERQREFTEASLKLAELKGQMSTFAKPATEPDPLNEVYDDAMKQRFVESPQEVLGEIIARQQRQFGKVLQQRDEYWENKVKTMLSEELNPERSEYRETLNELSQKGWFKELSPKAQLEAAKEYRGKSGKASVEPSATGFGGTGRRTTQTRTAAEERKAQAEAISKAIFSQGDNTSSLMPELTVTIPSRR